ncbi:unnamed protein product [Victoria cruziana]
MKSMVPPDQQSLKSDSTIIPNAVDRFKNGVAFDSCVVQRRGNLWLHHVDRSHHPGSPEIFDPRLRKVSCHAAAYVEFLRKRYVALNCAEADNTPKEFVEG